MAATNRQFQGICKKLLSIYFYFIERLPMKNFAKTPLALTLGTSLLAGFAVNVAHAETAGTQASPFAMTELAHGYMQMAEADAMKATEAKKADGSCGEAKCGAKKTESTEKMKEGSCGDKKSEGSCGAKKAEGDAKTDEGKCGAKK